MDNENIENKEAEEKYESLESENTQTQIRNAHVDKLQEHLNSLAIADRKKIFKRAVFVVFVLIIVKLCVGIACSGGTSYVSDKEKEAAAIAEDSLEQIANKILNYEFRKKRNRSPEVEEALNALVEQDRAEAEKRDSLLKSKTK